MRRSFAECRRWARAFLERCPEETLARAQALETAALVEVFGDPAVAQRLLKQARRLAARLDQTTLAAVEYNLGFAAFVGENVRQAVRHLERALSLMERLDDQHGSLGVKGILAWALSPDHRRREEARVRLERVLQQAKEFDDRYAAAIADYGLGLYWRWSGHPSRALERFRRALGTARELATIPTLAG